MQAKFESMARIFISYKRDDLNLVLPIKEKIEKATGERCWLDLNGIESDAVFANVIIKAIKQAEVFLFMYSKTHSAITNYENDWTVKEINFAQKRGKRIVFVNIDQSPLEDWFELMFGTKQQVDATSPDRLNKLIKDIKKWLDIPTNEQPDIPDHQTDESHVITPPEPKPEIEGDIFPVEVGGTTFNMIRVEGGEMEIGATAEQGKEAEKNEYPAHRIVCQTFYMSQFPITQNLWETVMGYNKAKYKEKEDKLSSDLEELKRTLGVSTLTTAALLALPAGLLMSAGFAYGANKARKWLAENLGDDTAKFGNVKGHYPIENITYEEALEFVNRLSQMTHLQFSLPTEDEWEYAARGGRQSRGTKYAGSNSIDEVAWYRDNADGTTHPVGEKKPNELGLYDMCGNVWEWTETPAHSYGLKIEVGGDVYIRRGGSWWHEAQNCRVSRRYPTSRAKKTSGLGIRVVIRAK